MKRTHVMKSMALHLFAVCLCAIGSANAIMFKLEPNTQKCLRDELHANQLVLGDYEVTDVPGQQIDYVVCVAQICTF